MYFTREDILKILKALLQIGTKDSEFKNAQLPLLEQDVIAVVQNGANRKVKVNDIIGLFNLLNRQDFINVSDMYDEHYITINEAIKLMPYRKRKEGLVITFQNTSGKWQIYQFKGTINEFVNPSLWEDLFGLEYLIINSIIPDEEDLTIAKPDEDGNSLLSFKDKEYDPEGFSGMATKILRKHIIEVNDSKLGKIKKNILYQDDFNQENCIYEIRYEFILETDVVIPENSILKFNGGYIKGNHTLIGQNTYIEADNNIIFKDGITISGTWNCPIIYSKWFNDITLNNRLKQLFNLSSEDIHNEIFIEKEEYTVSVLKERDSILVIKSNTLLHLNGIIRLTPNSFERFNILYAINAKNITICGDGSIYGDAKEHDYSSGTPHEWGINVLIQNSSNTRISGISVYDSIGDGIDVGGHDIIVEDFYAENCCRQATGNYSSIFYNVIFRNFVIKNCIGHIYEPERYGFGVCLEVDHKEGYVDNVEIYNGIVINCHQPIVINNHDKNLIHFKNIKVSNIKITDCTDINSQPPLISKAVENLYINNIYISNCISKLQTNIYENNNVIIDNLVINHSNESSLETDLSIYNNDSVFINNYTLKSTSNSKIRPTISGNVVIKNSIIKTNAEYEILGSSSQDRKIHSLIYNNCTFNCVTINVNRAVDILFNRCRILTTNNSVIQNGSNLQVVDSIWSSTIDSNLHNNYIFVIYNSKVFFKDSSIETITDLDELITNGVFHGYSDSTAEINIINCKLNFQGLNMTKHFIFYDISKYNILYNNNLIYPNIGESRPDFDTIFGRNKTVVKGFSFFDTTLNKSIYWTGTKWVDATGLTV